MLLRQHTALRGPAALYWNWAAARVAQLPAISRVRLNSDAATHPYEKRRPPGGDILVAIINRALAGRMVLLPHAAWLAYEPAIYRAVYGIELQVQARALRFPRLPGRRLDLVLADPTIATPARLRALQRALQSLLELHATQVTVPTRPSCAVRHADACIRNVLVDEQSDMAAWIDFETVHASNWSDLERRADDLRAFASSAAALLPPAQTRSLAEMLAHAADVQLLGALVERLAAQIDHPHPFYLAQTGAGPRTLARLVAALSC
jgi:hypothetical protein